MIELNIEWYAINDGYGVIGYGFYCFLCSKNNLFVSTDENEVICEYCHSVFKNPGDPDVEEK